MARTLAVLAVFVRFAHARSRLIASLAANAYAMYVVHYVFITWSQYALLSVAWPAMAKASLVFAMTVAASWATAAGVRRISAASC